MSYRDKRKTDPILHFFFTQGVVLNLVQVYHVAIQGISCVGGGGEGGGLRPDIIFVIVDLVPRKAE